MPEISRRAFGGLVGGGAVTAVAGTTTAAEAAQAPAERPFRARTGGSSGRRPNLLVILGDDLGWADLSSYGAPHIRTPNLDRLARQGVRFTDAYSGSSTCSPTRFSLYTGRYPGRTPGGLAEPIANRTQGLDPNHPTLASLLKKAGYSTALIGKWHCGWLPDYSPTKSGWDEFFGNRGGVLEYFSKLGQLGDHDLYEGDATHQDLRYYTEVLTERAVEYVSRDHTAPWLLNLNFTTPHWPWLAEGDEETGAEIAAKIRAARSQAEVSAALNHYDGGSVAKYTQMVESLDAAVGEVLTALRRSGQEEHTLVYFASDNGGERWSYLWPLSGEKFVLQEGGIRVPTIVRWPHRLDGGQVSHEPNFSPTGRRPSWRSRAPAPTRRTRWTGRASPDTCCGARTSRSGTCSGGCGPTGPCGAGTGSTTRTPRARTTSTTSAPTCANRPIWPRTGRSCWPS